jgi:hypothetical protein
MAAAAANRLVHVEDERYGQDRLLAGVADAETVSGSTLI